MESFSAAFTGALGPDNGITPEFDKLAAQGLLFERFFSNGTHTHQGMFAIGACFPNLPGYEYLMQQPEGQNRFSGLPTLLKPMGLNDVYVYNGHFAWDNQEGFFRNQGMSRFIGRDDYVNPVFIDATWGVSDEDMFNRSVEELNRLDSEQPFFAILQTLSNHTPYALPETLPVEAVSGFGNLDQHLTAQRYSDWALGQFFAKVATAPWYNETLFVIVGDHGFGLGRQLSDIGLLRFHVPLLLLGPGIQATYGTRNNTVATQVDVVPTIVSLLGKPFVHQCWGRDLLALPENDAGHGHHQALRQRRTPWPCCAVTASPSNHPGAKPDPAVIPCTRMRLTSRMKLHTTMRKPPPNSARISRLPCRHCMPIARDCRTCPRGRKLMRFPNGNIAAAHPGFLTAPLRSW